MLRANVPTTLKHSDNYSGASMKVYKYQITNKKRQDIELPEGAQILSLQLQKGIPTIWALVDPEAVTYTRRFFVVATGEEIGDHLEYVGTFQVPESELVFHIFKG